MNAIAQFTSADIAAAIYVLRLNGEIVRCEGPRIFVNDVLTTRRDVIQYAADLHAIEHGQIWRINGRKRALEA